MESIERNTVEVEEKAEILKEFDSWITIFSTQKYHDAVKVFNEAEHKPDIAKHIARLFYSLEELDSAMAYIMSQAYHKDDVEYIHNKLIEVFRAVLTMIPRKPTLAIVARIVGKAEIYRDRDNVTTCGTQQWHPSGGIVESPITVDDTGGGLVPKHIVKEIVAGLKEEEIRKAVAKESVKKTPSPRTEEEQRIKELWAEGRCSVKPETDKEDK